MKTCTKCFLSKPFDCFYKRSSSKDGLQSYCKECRKDIDAQSYASSDKRKQNIKSNSDKLKKYNKRLVSRYKSFCKCLLCKESEPVVLDLHHLDASEKEDNPSSLISYSTEKLKEEIRKCVVVCSNCHRKIHAGLVQLVE